jgi:glycosyltransferase involved in cell wall biosynthesis
MKIGLFIPNATFDLPGTPEVGGIETFSFTIGEALRQLGHEVVLFGGQPKPGRAHRATAVTLELHPYWETASIPDLGTRFQRLVQRLHFAWSSRHGWARHRCDLVLLAKPFDWPVAWAWKRARPELKVIMGFHGTDYFAGDHLFYGAVDAAFAVSKTVADRAEARVGSRPVLIPNPVDVDFFSPGDSLGWQKTNDWHLVSSGRLVGWKGFSHLIVAVDQFREMHQVNTRLTIAGDGPERDLLQAQIRELGLEHHVKLPGRLDPAALRDLLRSGDLYVQPSVGLEAFSISALEGACVGLPLLLSDQVGLADFLTAADAASYPARNLDRLVEELKHLYDRSRLDAAWLDRPSRHARLREQFSAERVARKILALVP